MGGQGLFPRHICLSGEFRMSAPSIFIGGTNVDDNRSMGLCGGRTERSSSTFVPAPIRARLSAYEARWGAYLVFSERMNPIPLHADPPFLRTRL